jgi:hypothetical protein
MRAFLATLMVFVSVFAKFYCILNSHLEILKSRSIQVGSRDLIFCAGIFLFSWPPWQTPASALQGTAESKSPPSLLRFAAIQGIEREQYLIDLTPQGYFVTAEAIQGVVR